MKSPVGTLRLLWWATLVCSVSGQAARAGNAKALGTAVETITADDLRRHTNVLASDTFEGREAGTRGGKAAGVYLIGELKKLGVDSGGENAFFQFFGNDYRNILAVIRGSDPQLRDDYVLVSAHYDHVGYGTRRNSYGPIGYIHNGADDNASGTAGLLELIEALKTMDPPPRRSILFAFWDAEEKGLLGSEHWIDHPTVPLRRVEMMFNLDMIGRLRKETLEVLGVRTASGLRRLLCEQNRPTDLILEFNWDTIRDSDHYPFYTRRIPFLMLHTKKHEDYHRPSDDVDKLNLAGMQQVARLLLRTIYTAADAPHLTGFRSAAFREDSSVKREQSRSLPNKPPRLGVTWEKRILAAKPTGGAADSDTPEPRLLQQAGVLRVSAVRRGSPGERGGLRAGDRVLSLASGGSQPVPAVEIDDASAFVLGAESPLTVVVTRSVAAELVEFRIPLAGSPQRLGISWRTDDAEPGIVTLTRVTPGSPAEGIGLKPNHRIYAVSGRSFRDAKEFYELVTTLPGPLRLLVEGRGRLREIELNLPPVGRTRDE